MESLWLRKIKRIVKLNPFYTQVFQAHNLIISFKIPTACVQGNNIYINPYFVSKLSNEEWNAVVKHEINYTLMRHFRR